jgi:hypothetical protein
MPRACNAKIFARLAPANRPTRILVAVLHPSNAPDFYNSFIERRVAQGPSKPIHVDMLFLKFRSLNSSRTIGPADSIELRGIELLFPPNSDPIARYQGGWMLGGQRCNYVECRAMLSILFEDATGRIGPVIGLRTSFYLRGVYAFAGREQVAKLDPLAGTWFRAESQDSWPRMRILAAPSS